MVSTEPIVLAESSEDQVVAGGNSESKMLSGIVNRFEHETLYPTVALCFRITKRRPILVPKEYWRLQPRQYAHGIPTSADSLINRGVGFDALLVSRQHKSKKYSTQDCQRRLTRGTIITEHKGLALSTTPSVRASSEQSEVPLYDTHR